MIAVLAKSAQFPFHEWLIDAMEGPTPVSAYLHSSTMVKAGVFTVLLLYPLFAAPGISTIMLGVGIFTAVIATLAATKEVNIKKIIAYSTIQELSIMLIAISLGAVLAAIYFFLIQSFYKALLFFSVGIVTKATGKDKLTEVSGLKTSKLIFLSTLFGVLSLAGFIPFSGFLAGSGISYSLASNLVIYAIMSGISMLTSFYIVRWFSFNSRKAKNRTTESGYLGQPKTMVYPVVVLAALTLVASVLFFSICSFLNAGGYLSYLQITDNAVVNVSNGIIFTVIVAVGAVLAYLVYRKHNAKTDERTLERVVYTRSIMNWGYNFVSLITCELASGIAVFDSFLNDWFDSLGRLTTMSGRKVRLVSVGNVNSYAFIFIISIITLFFFYYLVIT